MLDPDMPVQAAAGSDAAIAFALFEHIAQTDPASVAAKDDAISVFRECMDAVHHGGGASHEPRPLRLSRE